MYSTATKFHSDTFIEKYSVTSALQHLHSGNTNFGSGKMFVIYEILAAKNATGTSS